MASSVLPLLQRPLATKCLRTIVSSNLWLCGLGESLSSPWSVSGLLICRRWFEGAELLIDPSHLKPALRSVLSTYTRWSWLTLGLSTRGGSDPCLLSGCSGCGYFQFCCLAFTLGILASTNPPLTFSPLGLLGITRKNEDLMTTETNLRWNPVILVWFSKFLAQRIFKADCVWLTKGKLLLGCGEPRDI